jgi:antirestriction protein ArdC
MTQVGKSSADLYEQITTRIVEMLNEGTVPWRKPWSSPWPRNLFSRKDYQGFNGLFLALRGFAQPYWCTRRQAEKLGGTIKEEESKKSTVVVFWHPGYSNKVPLPAGVMYHRVPPFFKFYDVWNVEQTQGLEAHIPASAAREFVPIEQAEKIAAGMAEQPRIKCKGESAMYFTVSDTIWMPPQEHF